MSNINEEGGCPIKNKIFLGGACTSNWRDLLIPSLNYYEVSYFNPVVKDWTPECMKIEEEEKRYNCNIHLYYFDNTMTGMYSMAEMMKSCIDIEAEGIDDEGYVFKARHVCLTIFLVNTDGMTESQIRSFDACHSLASEVTGKVLYRKLTNDEELKNGGLAKDLKEIVDSIKVCRCAYNDDENDYEDDEN